MANQEKNNENSNIETIVKNDNKKNNNVGGFAKAVEFCKQNVRYIAAAGLFIVIVIALAKCSSKDTEGKKTPVATEATEAVTTETETANDYAKDAYPQINELVSNYYTAYAAGDLDTLATLAENISDTEKSYITVFSEQVEQYENISCYTKAGLDTTSYIVSVSLEMRFKDVETTAPGLEFFYVRTREDGSLYIDQRYSQFNLANNEQELEPEVEALIESFKQQEDVIALQTQVQAKYEEAINADENLKVMAETTIPDVIKVWASDQAAAVKAAEEAAKAEAEAAAKAAEEEAVKKAEEEKKAQELAAAVSVYALEKVNVRAEASETADKIGQLEAGAKTTRLEDKDGWSRIDYSNGTQGYVKSEFLTTEALGAAENAEETPEEPAANSNGLAEGSTITIQESTNIRESMDQSSAKVATVFAGEKVTIVMSYAEGWTKVTYGDKTGYILTELLQ